MLTGREGGGVSLLRVLLLLMTALLKDGLFIRRWGGGGSEPFAVTRLAVCRRPEPLQALVEAGPRLDGVLGGLGRRDVRRREECGGGGHLGRSEGRRVAVASLLPSEKRVIVAARLVPTFFLESGRKCGKGQQLVWSTCGKGHNK